MQGTHGGREEGVLGRAEDKEGWGGGVLGRRGGEWGLLWGESPEPGGGGKLPRAARERGRGRRVAGARGRPWDPWGRASRGRRERGAAAWARVLEVDLHGEGLHHHGGKVEGICT